MGEDIAGKPLDALARGNDDPFRANEPDGPRDRAQERPRGAAEAWAELAPVGVTGLREVGEEVGGQPRRERREEPCPVPRREEP